jgi:predicted LPLAT superfamily acyltransferase
VAAFAGAVGVSQPEQGHWAEIGEAGFVGGMRLLVWVYRHLGRLPFRLVLYPVLGYFFLVRGSARRASLEYLTRLQQSHQVFAQAPSWSLAWAHFMSFAEAMLDKVLALAGEFPLQGISVHGREQLLTQIDAGRGGVLLTAHVGNLEVCRALGEMRPNLRLNILIHSRNAEKFNRLLARHQGPQRVRLIEISEITPGTAMQLSERVAAGEYLVIAADRLTPGSGRRSADAPFLGAPAPWPIGPFMIASLLQCPVHLVFCTRRGAGYHIEFEPFAERIERGRGRGGREAVLQPYVARFAQRVERQCQLAPLQWFNFYPFWRQNAVPATPPPAQR